MFSELPYKILCLASIVSTFLYKYFASLFYNGLHMCLYPHLYLQSNLYWIAVNEISGIEMDLTLTEEKTVAWTFEVTFEVHICIRMCHLLVEFDFTVTKFLTRESGKLP